MLSSLGTLLLAAAFAALGVLGVRRGYLDRDVGPMTAGLLALGVSLLALAALFPAGQALLGLDDDAREPAGEFAYELAREGPAGREVIARFDKATRDGSNREACERAARLLAEAAEPGERYRCAGPPASAAPRE